MKKLIFLLFAFGMMQVSAQNLSTQSKSDASSSDSMIENLVADQVKSFTEKLNLNEKQQEQVSGLVVSQFKSEKFQKMIGSMGNSKALSSGSSSDMTKKIQSTLLSDQGFRKEMGSILDDNQKGAMKKYIPQ
ncbi:hypothetical protein [Xanthomarina sp. GH4-25]|uniref:hypothetical protein n=1 Tax=Xanthomarina sp. GH4-25 TaxID=3349335 RepID=UPI000D67FBC3|nr:hypothetical protein DI383_05435 [Flavobacteriaceae bacterium LYZ1037]